MSDNQEDRNKPEDAPTYIGDILREVLWEKYSIKIVGEEGLK